MVSGRAEVYNYEEIPVFIDLSLLWRWTSTYQDLKGWLSKMWTSILSFKRCPYGNDSWPISLGDLNVILSAWNGFQENTAFGHVTEVHNIKSGNSRMVCSNNYTICKSAYFSDFKYRCAKMSLLKVGQNKRIMCQDFAKLKILHSFLFCKNNVIRAKALILAKSLRTR